VLKEVADPRAFGVAVLAGERLERVLEKPATPPSNLAVIGVYAFRREVFEVIARLRPSARGELEIADAINGLIEGGLTVDTSVTTEHWIDTGKMEDMLAANRAVLDSEPFAATPADCDVVAPCAIHPTARVTRSRIGPYVAIGPNCVITDCVIENSIVMEDTVIEDSPGIMDSMIGRFAFVQRAPLGARLTLGDHSRFEGPA
jgi:glucose-1-phosphate thymidylyltransferase